VVVGAITSSGGVDNFSFSASGNVAGGANSLVAVYENGIGADTNSLLTLFSSTPASSITEVTNSSFVASFGLGEADDFWQGRTPTGTLATVFSAPSGSGQISYEFGLSVLSNPGALPIVTNGVVTGAPGHAGTAHDVNGDGSAFARSPGVNTGWDLSTNTNAVFLTKNVPEPEVLAMLSMGLLAGSFMQRRRSK